MPAPYRTLREFLRDGLIILRNGVDAECPICSDHLGSGASVNGTSDIVAQHIDSPCGAHYHVGCLLNWLALHNPERLLSIDGEGMTWDPAVPKKCPTCRTSLLARVQSMFDVSDARAFHLGLLGPVQNNVTAFPVTLPSRPPQTGPPAPTVESENASSFFSGGPSPDNGASHRNPPPSPLGGLARDEPIRLRHTPRVNIGATRRNQSSSPLDAPAENNDGELPSPSLGSLADDLRRYGLPTRSTRQWADEDSDDELEMLRTTTALSSRRNGLPTYLVADSATVESVNDASDRGLRLGGSARGPFIGSSYIRGYSNNLDRGRGRGRGRGPYHAHAGDNRGRSSGRGRGRGQPPGRPSSPPARPTLVRPMPRPAPSAAGPGSGEIRPSPSLTQDGSPTPVHRRTPSPPSDASGDDIASLILDARIASGRAYSAVLAVLDHPQSLVGELPEDFYVTQDYLLASGTMADTSALVWGQSPAEVQRVLGSANALDAVTEAREITHTLLERSRNVFRNEDAADRSRRDAELAWFRLRVGAADDARNRYEDERCRIRSNARRERNTPRDSVRPHTRHERTRSRDDRHDDARRHRDRSNDSVRYRRERSSSRDSVRHNARRGRSSSRDYARHNARRERSSSRDYARHDARRERTYQDDRYGYARRERRRSRDDRYNGGRRFGNERSDGYTSRNDYGRDGRRG
ncbi:hypothetical protein HBH69_060910 [Parastagonospora nodorum]|nr:hypothetical protein HBH69_060910 [Parastagonospora nodorum]